MREPGEGTGVWGEEAERRGRRTWPVHTEQEGRTHIHRHVSQAVHLVGWIEVSTQEAGRGKVWARTGWKGETAGSASVSTTSESTTSSGAGGEKVSCTDKGCCKCESEGKEGMRRVGVKCAGGN